MKKTSPPPPPPSLLYGTEHEARARARYTAITGRVVQECGCYIDGILLTSPDGYIPELDHLLEIKGLASQRNQPVIQAVKQRQSEKSYPYAIDVHGKLHLKMIMQVAIMSRCRWVFQERNLWNLLFFQTLTKNIFKFNLMRLSSLT